MALHFQNKIGKIIYLSVVAAILTFSALLITRETPQRHSIDSLATQANSFHERLLLVEDSLKSIYLSIAKDPDLYGIKPKIRSTISKISIRSDYAFFDGVIDPRKFRYRINSALNICKNSRYAMFIYVHSSTANHERRRILRETWANTQFLKSFNVGLVFITGILTNDSQAMANVAAESERYGDIVQTEYVDTYPNITIKSTTSLSWAATYCAPYVPVILKTDDDMFVNITRLMKFVKIDLPKIISVKGDKLILCNCWTKEPVVRVQSDRYYIPMEIYNKKLYPPFCQGSALVMTSKAAIGIRQALIGVELFPLDDVLITGFVAQQAGVKLIAMNDRYLETLKGRKITKKELQSDFIYAHTDTENLLKLWKLDTLYHQYH